MSLRERRSGRSLTRRAFLRVALGAAGVGVVAAAPPLVRGAVSPGDDSGGGSVAPPAFNSERSYRYLLEQVRFGPRVPGTRAHIECRDYLHKTLRASLGNASLQPFELRVEGLAIPMWNVLAAHDPRNPRQVLLCAHWDTRPTADEEPDPADRSQPIEGANDGASGVAVLLEIAGLLRSAPPPCGVRFVLFDGEDYGPDEDRMYLGAKHYARTLPQPQVEWGVLLDMVGDRDLGIWRESNSEQAAREVNDRIWAAARAAGHAGVFHDSVRWSITDDHLPLLAAGAPVVDLIDFDYPYWHTRADTADKCSPRSLAAVGETVLQALYAG